MVKYPTQGYQFPSSLLADCKSQISHESHSLLRFLVACTRLYDPLCPSVCLSVGPSVRRSVGHTLLFRRYGRFLRYCSCPNAWVSLYHHCPCPPARDFGSCIRPCFIIFRFLYSNLILIPIICKT